METLIIRQTVMTLLQALSTLYPDSSKTALKSWIKEGRVTIDGIPCKEPLREIREGEKVALGAKTRYVEGGIRILFEDSDLVVIDKPEGLLSVATAFEKKETAYALLSKSYHPRKVHVVHRLDQDTSGVMLFALSERGKEACKILFEKHDLQRIYFALVEGHLSQPSGTWRSYQYEDAQYYVHTTDDPLRGKLAITHYCVKETSKRFSLLELTLETGRKNQIRVHCQAAGHPIVGDKKYGSSVHSGRLFLHAHLLAFTHPFTGKELKFTSEVPFTSYTQKS